MKKIAVGTMSFLVSGLALHAQVVASQRSVHGHSVESTHDPRVQIELPRQAKFAGTDHWTLYDVTDCELFLFVEADAQKTIRKMYWIQFESYIPSRPELKYSYGFKQVAKLGGLDFDLRARFGPTGEKPKEGSDGEHVQKLLLEKGYKFPAEMMNVRFVHLPDATRRKEMMIIYSEDMKPTGLTFAELVHEGRTDDRWAEIQKKLIERAEKKILFKTKEKR